MAPFTPFLSEEIYRNLTSKESVHLALWPVADESLIDAELSREMAVARELVTTGLKLRADAKIKVRQPLLELYVGDVTLRTDLQEILQEELNVKSIVSGKPLGLNVEITEDLRLEGEAREIIRAIQEGRKKAGFNVEDRIALGYQGKEKVFASAVLKEMIQKEILATEDSVEGALADADYTDTVEIEGESFSFSLKRV